MNALGPVPPASRPIKIAILAVGGQGGGVLSDWIVSLASANGYVGQSTSVPGVAQRTGMTVYYLELLAEDAVGARAPVLGLTPAMGDVDIVIAAELLEAGRAMVRGLVSPDRTVLVASTHRIYTITEKSARGDGRTDPAKVLAAAQVRARRLIAFDMAKTAETAGSVISAVLFGALAASGALPFRREAYESTIAEAGIGVAPSLAAFAAGYERAASATTSGALQDHDAPPPPAATTAAGERLLTTIGERFPAAARPILWEGVKRLVDYQDLPYAHLFLDRLDRVAALDRDPSARLLTETARYLALWMSYEDVIRVADLKVRSRRFQALQSRFPAGEQDLLRVSEFMHPRIEELCDCLPTPLGRWLLKARWARGLLAPFFRKGRRVTTTGLLGFLLLYALAALRPTRRWSLRSAIEADGMRTWLDRVADTATTDYALACELAECPRLIKGYGDTPARGRSAFDRIMEAVASGADAAWVGRAREAALTEA